jgi:hypothetical protein
VETMMVVVKSLEADRRAGPFEVALVGFHVAEARSLVERSAGK